MTNRFQGTTYLSVLIAFWAASNGDWGAVGAFIALAGLLFFGEVIRHRKKLAAIRRRLNRFHKEDA